MGYLEAQNRRSANNFLRSGTKCLFNLNSRFLIMYLVATQDKWNVIFLCSNATSLINTISVTCMATTQTAAEGRRAHFQRECRDEAEDRDSQLADVSELEEA